MKGTELTTRLSLVRPILMIGVLFGLCFSAGVGLRLTPFPAPVTARAAAPEARYRGGAQPTSSLYKYCPLDKPSQWQVQKRGKRPSTHCECPPDQNTHRPDNLLRDPGARGPVALTTTLHVSEPAGRAPPARA